MSRKELLHQCLHTWFMKMKLEGNQKLENVTKGKLMNLIIRNIQRHEISAGFNHLRQKKNKPVGGEHMGSKTSS
ncbi:hypothetical protein RDI58_003089 [Solanum bulbocastanum]|uniref:Uncharacterized protein n=1 Tax=Solanum bulbocastanum TaxID=147425 RepID=A0AAN8YRS7_SOLBU